MAKISPKERMALALKRKTEAADNGAMAPKKEPAVEETPMPAKQEPVVEAPAEAPVVRRKKRRGIGAAAVSLPKAHERKVEKAEEKPVEEPKKEEKPEEKPEEEPKEKEKPEEKKVEDELPGEVDVIDALDKLAEGEARPLDELIDEGRIDEAYNKVNQELVDKPGERAECLLKIGLKCKETGKENEAVKYCNEALTAAKKITDENERGELSIRIRNEMKSNGIKILLSMGRGRPELIPPPPRELKPPEAGKPAEKPKPVKALHVFGPKAEEDDKTRVEPGEDSQTEIYEDFGVQDAEDDSVTEEVDEIIEEESKEESTHEETTLLFEALEDDEKTVVNETSRKLKKDIEKSGEDPILVILKELEAIKGTVGMVIDTKIKAAKTDLEARIFHRLSEEGDIGKRIDEKIESEVEDEGRLGTLLINILKENPDVLAGLKEMLALEEVGRAEAQEKAVEAREELDVMEIKREMLDALKEKDAEKAEQKWKEVDGKYAKMLDEETNGRITAELLYEILRLGEEHLKENYGLSDEEATYVVDSVALEKVSGALVEEDFQGRLEIYEKEHGTESLARGLKAIQELGVKGMLEKFGVAQENAEKAVERANQIMNDVNQEGDG